jgi:prolyl oligopeptidase
MEDLESPEVAAWIAAQNAVTAGYLDTLPIRERLRSRITELWNYPKVGLPVTEAGRLFYQKNAGLEKQAPVYMREGVHAPPRLVFDPNAGSRDGGTALMDFAPSPDGRRLAYSLADSGADWQTVHVRDVASGQDSTNAVRWVRFSTIAWTRDSAGFFYSRFPEPPAGKVYEAALSGHALYYHRVGTAQDADRLICRRLDLPTWFISGTVTEDGRYLLIALFEGATNNNRLYFADLADPEHPDLHATLHPLVESDDAEYAPVGSRGSTLFLRTDAGAPNRKVIAIDLSASPVAPPRTIVADGEHTLGFVALVGGRLVAEYLAHVKSRLETFDLARGEPLGGIPLPGAGVVAGLAGRADGSILWLQFTSPLMPATVVACDLASGQVTPFEPAAAPIDPAAFRTTQEFAISKDGTRIPVFITSRTDLARDGTAPLMLYGYGGFSVNTLPAYRPDVPAWLELGGAWATANIRGGAEYGESWHRGGMGVRKQNVFDDFIAVAEHLVREGYTSPDRLAIMGGSNGGLLVAAVMEQRPGLFAAALPAVGVLDMLRYDRFTGGRAWVTEYGTAQEPGGFAILFAYSPLHNLRPGTCYPATLITTADHDDRVVPSHSFKFAAALQQAQGCGRPVLIRIEAQGSHGYRPTDRRIAELADQWAFAAVNTGLATDTRDPGAGPVASGSRPEA